MFYKRLEREFSLYTGTHYAVAVNSGTAALHLALAAYGIKEGDEVIVPEFTMIATAFAVSYTGAKPVFVDCDDRLCIDPSLIEEKITPRTKAIIPVHVYGRVADMDTINQIALKHDLVVIEDAAEAHGAYDHRGKAGSLGDAGCFSFYQNKIVHGQEGGIVTTDNEELYRRMKSMKCMSFTDDHDFMHTEIGFNYRMPEDQARRILASLYLIDDTLEGRRREDGGVKWVQDIVYESEEKRDLWLEKFRNDGKKVRHFFKPMSMQPMYFNESYKDTKAFDYSKRGLYLALD